MFSDFICTPPNAASTAEQFSELFTGPTPFKPAPDWVQIKHNPVRDVFKKDSWYIKVDHRKFHTFKHEFNMALALKRHGIPVVEHLLCARTGTENFLITAELKNSIPAGDFLDSPADKTNFIAALTGFMEQWQNTPFEHTDPHFGNLLYIPETNRLFLVDVHDIKQRFFPCRCRKDIARFIFNLRGRVPYRTIIDLMTKFQIAEPEKSFCSMMQKEFARIKKEWQKRKKQLFDAYPKFSYRKDNWLICTPYKEISASLPAEFTADAQAEFAASTFLNLLQIPHRRCVAVDLQNNMVKRTGKLSALPDDEESAMFTQVLALCGFTASPGQYRLYNDTAALDEISGVAKSPLFKEG